MGGQLYAAILVVVCVYSTSGCQITNFVNMPSMERFIQSEMVIYGKVTEHILTKGKVDGKYQDVLDVVYHVHCILKPRVDEQALDEYIKIHQVAPQHGCSGTKETMFEIGVYSIVALKVKMVNREEKIMLDEIMPGTSAAIHALRPYFFSISNICGMQNWLPPRNASSNLCPICGVTNFATAVGTMSSKLETNCRLPGSTIATEMADCDLYIDGTIETANAQYCVPSDFYTSCVTLFYRLSDARCSCVKRRKNNNIEIGDIGGGAADIIGSRRLVITIFAMWMFLFVLNK